jgi:hypothetical protein
MFVRWNRRERVSRKRIRYVDKEGRFVRWGRPDEVRERRTGEFLLIAHLVRSERRDGKPRQKVVGYLGSIREEAEYVGHRKHFWEHADKRLDALALEAEERRRIEAALLARVPRPTAGEVEAEEREFAVLWRRLTAKPGET